MAGAAAQVTSRPSASGMIRLPSGKDDVVDLRLDVVHEYCLSAAMSISLSK
jgi:hypothetical protein